MKTMSEQISKMASFKWWYDSYEYKEVDQAVVPYLNAEIKPYKVGDSWLRKVREASLISGQQAAEVIGVTRAGYFRYEDTESTGKISLESLAKAAEALDCELVYAIRPKKRERFSSLIWKKISKKAELHSWVQSRPEKSQAQALAKIAKDVFKDPEFRREQGWTERRWRQFKIKSKSV